MVKPVFNSSLLTTPFHCRSFVYFTPFVVSFVLKSQAVYAIHLCDLSELCAKSCSLLHKTRNLLPAARNAQVESIGDGIKVGDGQEGLFP